MNLQGVDPLLQQVVSAALVIVAVVLFVRRRNELPAARGLRGAMLRMTVRRGVALETTTSFEGSVGGAELNACIAAVRAGMPATWVSALPDNSLGRHVRRHVRANGVEAVAVTRPQARLGLYFLEMESPPRSLRITYDRMGSASRCSSPTASTGSASWHRTAASSSPASRRRSATAPAAPRSRHSRRRGRSEPPSLSTSTTGRRCGPVRRRRPGSPQFFRGSTSSRRGWTTSWPPGSRAATRSPTPSTDSRYRRP